MPTQTNPYTANNKVPLWVWVCYLFFKFLEFSKNQFFWGLCLYFCLTLKKNIMVLGRTSQSWSIWFLEWSQLFLHSWCQCCLLERYAHLQRDVTCIHSTLWLEGQTSSTCFSCSVWFTCGIHFFPHK